MTATKQLFPQKSMQPTPLKREHVYNNLEQILKQSHIHILDATAQARINKLQEKQVSTGCKAEFVDAVIAALMQMMCNSRSYSVRQ